MYTNNDIIWLRKISLSKSKYETSFLLTKAVAKLEAKSLSREVTILKNRNLKQSSGNWKQFKIIEN